MNHEAQLLRLITLHPRELLECHGLEPKHFADQRYRRIFESICRIYDSGQKMSMTAIKADIAAEWVDDLLVQLLKVKVDGGGRALTNALIDAYAARTAIGAMVVYRDIIKGNTGQRAAITELATALLDIANDKIKSKMMDGYQASGQLLDIVRNPDKKSLVVNTGISLFDDKIGGVQKGLLSIVSGVPGMGKSLFMANLILNMALAGKHVHVGSLEDRSIYVMGRLLGRLAGINSEPLIKSQAVSMEVVKRLEETRERNMEALKRIHIDDSSGQSFTSIRRTCMKLQSAGELDVSFVDHLGELKKMSQREYTAATMNVEGIRDIANDLDIPVVLGCQVSKSAVTGNSGAKKNHEEYIPHGHHLRDSGRILEVARMVMFVHRPHKWDNTQPEEAFWVNVDKQSHGKTGLIKLETNLETMHVYSPAEKTEYNSYD